MYFYTTSQFLGRQVYIYGYSKVRKYTVYHLDLDM